MEWKGPCGIDGRQCESRGARGSAAEEIARVFLAKGRHKNRLNRAAGPAMKLAGSLAGGSPRLRLGLCLVLALEIERHCGADEILQGVSTFIIPEG